jgi:anionic cell wall polymer biosynthesis LytR-Cps2A-Psr (LCP) family protein
MYYGYDPLYIKAGMTHMDGTLALKYARTRHQTSDFDRVKRQQQVVLAAREKILNANLLPQLIIRSPEIWNQFSNNVHSDLTLDQLLQLLVYLKDVPKENIHQGVIDISDVTGLNYNGAAVLVPERARLGPLLTQVFGANYAQ